MLTPTKGRTRGESYKFGIGGHALKGGITLTQRGVTARGLRKKWGQTFTCHGSPVASRRVMSGGVPNNKNLFWLKGEGPLTRHSSLLCGCKGNGTLKWLISFTFFTASLRLEDFLSAQPNSLVD